MKRTFIVLLIFIAVLVGGLTLINQNQKSSDPTTDEIGYENGVYATEAISVTTNDGLSESEIESITARAMARVETIRQYEFTENISIEIKQRNEIQINQSYSDTERQKQNLLYESTFIVPEETDVTSRLNRLRKQNVNGYYNSRTNTLVVIKDSLSEPLLGHELVHALQDQHDLLKPNTTRSYDGQLAWDTLVEGDATNVQRSYEGQCTVGWNCIHVQSQNTQPRTTPLRAIILYPYTQGDKYISQEKNNCWCNINQKYFQPPQTTSETIGDSPSTAEPQTIIPTGPGITQKTNPITVGEGTMAVMLATPEIRSNKTTKITDESFFSKDSVYNYNFEATAGWRGDNLVGYSVNGTNGYIWAIRFTSAKDANQFKNSYIDLLQYYNGERTGAGWETHGEFSDGFVVEVIGPQVVIYNGETVEKAQRLHEASHDSYGHNETN